MVPVALTRRMLVIAALCFAPPANGAEITVGLGGTIIRLSGPINLGDEKVFEAKTRIVSNPTNTVVLLNSPGGYVLPALLCRNGPRSTSLSEGKRT